MPELSPAVADFLVALERETPCTPAWGVGDLGMHPTMGRVVIAAVDATGAFPRYLAFPCDRSGTPLLDPDASGWVSGAFLA